MLQYPIDMCYVWDVLIASVGKFCNVHVPSVDVCLLVHRVNR
jgi:hypothetical protein